MFDKGIMSYQCKRNLIINETICGYKACEASYNDFSPYSVCKSDCMKRLDESMIQKKARTRVCNSDEATCKEEGGKEETLFCENQSLCLLQDKNPITGRLEVDNCPDVTVKWIQKPGDLSKPTLYANISLSIAEVIL